MTDLLHTQLENSAQLHPERLALVAGDQTLDYSTLDARANQIAHLLIRLGVGPGERVGLFLDKSSEAIAGLYGAMKAGAAYVPLDPAAPTSRIAHIIADCGLTTLISSSKQHSTWPEIVDLGAPVSNIVAPDSEGVPEDWPEQIRLFGSGELAAEPEDSPSVPISEDDLALILYTSGSTGNPKGVMLSHRNVLGCVAWAAKEFALAPDDRLSQLAPLHFDLSTIDIFGAAIAGASVHLVPRQTIMFPMQIRRFLESQRISVVYAVPSILTMMVERAGLETGSLPDLRTILFAGEVFPTKYLSRLMHLLPHTEFANLFGPTETNVCTFYRVPVAPPPDGPPISIGKAISGVETSVVAKDGAEVPDGEVGELWVRGPTVMSGYWGSDRSLEDAKAGLYRTGDLVKATENGDYEFIGRRDSQIKSRGYRIELGDIEAALQAHPDIVECAVIPIPDDLVTNRITAHVVERNGLTEEEIVKFVSDRIPKYMVPESFDFHDGLPKTSTGKIDRQTLIATQRSGQ